MGILFTSFHECHYERRDVTFTFAWSWACFIFLILSLLHFPDLHLVFISWASSCFQFLILILFSFLDSQLVFISWFSTCFHCLILILSSFSDPHRAWYTGSAWLLTFPGFASSPRAYFSGILLADASCPLHHGHLFLIITWMLRYTTCCCVSDVVTFTHTNRFHIHIACFDNSPNIR